MTKDDIQNIAIARLSRTKRLICQWATGCGKSRVAIRFLDHHPNMSCLILVPEQNNIQNWEEEFDKAGVDRSKVTIMCYASFHKQVNTKWGLLVFDEMPHIDTERRLYICNSVSGDFILALGAVIDKDERESIESVYGPFEKYEIDLTWAIGNKILPPPRVNVLHLQLDDVHKKYVHKGMYYTAKQRYNYIQKKVENASATYKIAQNKFNYNNMLRAGNERKRFLGALKEDALRRVCDGLALKKKRFLCFCSSIEQANRIGKDHAFTSETPTSLKLLDKFNNHELDSLFVVGKLIEGQNLKDIEVGVIGQLGGTQRITVQSIGRVMRSPNPVIYVLVFDDTQDNSFLYTLTSSISKEYIKHYKFK